MNIGLLMANRLCLFAYLVKGLSTTVCLDVKLGVLVLENRISAVEISALLLMIATGVIKGELSGNKMFRIELVLCERTARKTF